MTITDMDNTIKSVLGQNALKLRNGMKDGTMSGTVNRKEYVVGLQNGVVGQFYPVL